MDERLFARLAVWLDREPIVLASVIATRGATPRKRGARMLVSADGGAFSVGGGMAEARVVEAARQLLDDDGASSRSMEIDLGGGPEAAGICGGRMRVALRRWCGAADRARVADIAAALADGRRVALDEDDLGAAVADEFALPDPRLLIVGGGHCGEALYRLAGPLGFDRRVYDGDDGGRGLSGFDPKHLLRGDPEILLEALHTARPVLAVLLNRDYHADVAALDVLCRRPPAFLGMMGSRRRIGTVREALPQHAGALEKLVAPVGLDIGAESPEEIAVSILAQLIAFARDQSESAAGG